MSLQLLSLINQEGSLEIGEACLYGLIGFLIVFLGISLIIFIIWIIGLVLRKTNNLEFLTKIGKNKRKKIEAVTETDIETSDDTEIPNEVKAAIIAAIMAFYSAEKPECEFKVKRIKRF